MKILIVEDNPDDRLLLRTNLEARACDVVEAADGIEGFALAKEHKPALIISDALMPRMDGFQLLRKMRQDDELKTTPFVFYSASYTGQEEVDLAMSLGANTYIFKPKEPDEFWNEIRKLLDECELKKGLGFKETILRDEEYLRRYTDIVATKLEEKIRELEKARDSAEASRNQYQKLFDASLDGIYSTDEHNRFLHLNIALARMFGYDRPEEMVGMSTLDFWANSEARDLYVRELMTKKGLSAYPVHARKKDGGDLSLEISCNILEDENGRFMGIEGIARDTTEREKLEGQLRQAQKMEAIGLLAGGVAHDFNNILSAIIGYGHLSLMKMKDDDPLKINIDQILEASQRAAALTQSLLAFSRKQPVRFETVDLNALIRRFEKFLLRLIREDITLRISCTGPMRTPPVGDGRSPQSPLDKRGSAGGLLITADAGQIEQVIMNLVANARDAIPGVGQLTIETGHAHLDQSFVDMHGYGDVGDYAILTISDTGCGMDERTRERIFEPFFTTKEQGKGTGLGLAMVYGTIKQHNGFINVYSEPGKGTTFRIYLPAAEASAEPRAFKERREGPVKGGTETILLAEDDASLRKLVRTILEQAGYTVIDAVDGRDALEKFIKHKERVQFAVLDGIMPRMNGKEAYAEIHALNPGMRCIFMSGYAEDVFLKDGIVQRNVEFLQKPVTPTALLGKVREVLGR